MFLKVHVVFTFFHSLLWLTYLTFLFPSFYLKYVEHFSKSLDISSVKQEGTISPQKWWHLKVSAFL
jgi:hypothetical protein